ncbi:hypothetical protein EOA25_38965, partial [Mesorhizobium sp. M2A.F.Ca.ET.040.01.1.1]
MKALVLTPKTLFRLSQFSISDEWFSHFGTPDGDASIKRVEVGNVVYLFEPELETDETPIVVVNLAADGVLADKASRAATLERIITAGRFVFTDSVSIPTGWRKHHEGSMFSIQAVPRNFGWKPRLHFETRP